MQHDYTKYDIKISPNSNCKPGLVSPTLNVNPTLFVILCKSKFGRGGAGRGGLIDLQRCKNCHLPSDHVSSMTTFIPS